MKAIIHTQYGAPEVLQLAEVPKPVPASDEVLVKIFATTVNRTDCGFRKPEYLMVYLIAGLFKPKNKILGTEFAGVVEAVGAGVTKFNIGDNVFGLRTYKFGTHAEYVCVKQNGSIATKPHNMNFQEAAAVCDGLMLAINYIRKIDFSKPVKLLINGASGSIGTAAVQLGKYYGAQIHAVANTKNIELIKSLGAEKVFDYTQEDFTKQNEQYDVILDAVGKSSYFKCKHLLKSGGVYFSTELGYAMQNMWLPLVTVFMNKKTKFPIPTDNQQDILLFKKIIEEGKYRAIIERVYPLHEIIEATKYVETGQKTGNIVIQVNEG